MHTRHFRAVAAICATAFTVAVASASAAPTDVDTGFGKNGKALINVGGDDTTYGITTQADGKTIGVGYTDGGSGSFPVDALVYRLNTDGSRDKGFGARALDAGRTEFGYAVATQPDGKVVVV